MKDRMAKKHVMWDLFSGLGGASQYFDLNENWEVYRFENNYELLPYAPLNTQWRDVIDWRRWSKDYPEPDFIWASPPCLEFSTAYNAPRSIANRAGEDFQPNLELVETAKDIIDYYQPDHWAIENVVGASKHLSPALGRYQKIGPFLIWGNLPPVHAKVDDNHKEKVDQRHSPIRSNIRARIPIEMSRAVFNAIKQPTLGDF